MPGPVLSHGLNHCLNRSQPLLQLGMAVRDHGYQFTAVTPATHDRVNRRPGNEWGSDLRGVFGWSRPFQPSAIPPRILELMHRAGVIAAAPDGWRSLVRMATLGDALYLHSAWPTDAVDAVFFGPDTYRFANALDACLETLDRPLRRAVDIGCGAGPGAIHIALARPDTEVIAVDINDLALEMTGVNAALANVHNLRVQHSNLLAAVDGSFDLIVANPPFLVDPAMRAYRHGGGELGAGLSLAIVDAAMERLSPGGTLLLYTGIAILPAEADRTAGSLTSAIHRGHDPFRAAVERRLEGSGLAWTYREMDPDIFGEELAGDTYASAERIAAVVLTATRAPLPS